MTCAGNSTDPIRLAGAMVDHGSTPRGWRIHAGVAEVAAMSRTPTPIVRTGQTPPAIPGYELLHRVGQGGMGEVYVARQLALGRLVAVKFLVPVPEVDPHEALD